MNRIDARLREMQFLAQLDRDGAIRIQKPTEGGPAQDSPERHWQICARDACAVGQGAKRVLAGHDQYYAVPTNTALLRQFRDRVEWTWHRSLQRRSQRGRWNGEHYRRFRERFPIPPPRILHPWPNERFYARANRGGSPVREIRTPGSIRGAP